MIDALPNSLLLFTAGFLTTIYAFLKSNPRQKFLLARAHSATAFVKNGSFPNLQRNRALENMASFKDLLSEWRMSSFKEALNKKIKISPLG